MEDTSGKSDTVNVAGMKSPLFSTLDFEHIAKVLFSAITSKKPNIISAPAGPLLIVMSSRKERL